MRDREKFLLLFSRRSTAKDEWGGGYLFKSNLPAKGSLCCFINTKQFYISSGEIDAHIILYSTILYPLRGNYQRKHSIADNNLPITMIYLVGIYKR